MVQRRAAFGLRLRTVIAGLAMTLAAASPGQAGSELATGPSSGLPVPRFVSLKPDKVNVRAGPTRDHEVTWQFTRAGLPVEITAESDNWRRIRDWEGSEGWVYHSLLSGRRTALVITKLKEELVALYRAADDRSPILARLQPGVTTSVRRCTGKWCQVTGTGFDGWIAQERLWGVYPNETIN
ncbi:MAG: SH3 domain-containing protein [Hyphomicrobiales bacterium]|nr:SH3 domain-containing protein [Hyphomicrobiales bacterium]